MNTLIRQPSLFLMSVAVLSGCIDMDMRPPKDPVVIEHVRMFEEGRRYELHEHNESNNSANILHAVETYESLIKKGSRYGEYGLARLLYSWDDYEEAVKYFLMCAKRSSYTSDLFPDSVMDSAFSAAAMAELASIAEHDRPDVADSLRRTMSDVVTPEVRAWAYTMKTNAVSEKIYRNVISAIESCRQSREYVKVLEWSEISSAFFNEGASGGGRPIRLLKSSYSVVRFVKIPGVTSQYDFEVRLDGNNNTFDADKMVESAIRRHLVEEFLAENPHDSADDVRISRRSWDHFGSTIKGSVVAMKVSAVRLEYDDTTGRGKIAVRLDGRNVSAAKEWALKNIGELAAGKNIVLVAGRPPPPGARYKAGSERMTEDGLLEIEFTVL